MALLLYAAASMAAVLAFPRVWLAASLSALIVAYALWALSAEPQADMAAPVIMTIAFAALLFLSMLGVIALRRRSRR